MCINPCKPSFVETSSSSGGGSISGKDESTRSLTSCLSTSSLCDSSTEELLSLRRHKKRVSFGHIETRSFEVVRGHPELEMAHPLSLGWECLDESQSSIDDYEENRLPRVSSEQDLKTNCQERRKIIKRSTKLSGRRRNNKSAPAAFFRAIFPKRHSLAGGMA